MFSYMLLPQQWLLILQIPLVHIPKYQNDTLELTFWEIICF